MGSQLDSVGSLLVSFRSPFGPSCDSSCGGRLLVGGGGRLVGLSAVGWLAIGRSGRAWDSFVFSFVFLCLVF